MTTGSDAARAEFGGVTGTRGLDAGSVAESSAGGKPLLL